jgi:hypothetical protein
MAAAQRFLDLGHSDPFTHHAYLVAAQRLAFFQAARGALSLALIDRFQARCQQALSLDPTEPELQDDWVAFRIIKAWRLQSLGRDPAPELVAALAFLDTWAREPVPVEFRADRMLIYMLLAERRLARGEDPRQELAAALANLGHTTGFRPRDYLGDVLNLKARVEAARGQDPRPTLADALARMQAQLERRASWTLCETAAESWRLRADWEAGHGLDARASLQHSQALVDLALQINERSSTGHALKGLTEMLGARLYPEARTLHLARARRQLLLA